MTAPLRAFRVGVVGARRVRQGTGPYLAKYHHAAGTKVVAVSATSAATAEEAARDLRESAGIAATPYAAATEMIARERLDALVVASPAESHVVYLEAALSARLHVLCEKPFVWHDGDFDRTAERLAAAFSGASLCLAVATQWRHALGTWMRLFPDVSPRAATSFEMRLSPRSVGDAMLPDAMPHPLALLAHLHPAPGEPLENLVVEARSEEDAEVRFVHPGPRGGVRSVVRLVHVASPPRPFAFGFDGRRAHREIREPGYRTFLRDREAPGAREIELPDPMEALVRAFVAAVRKGPPFPADPAIVDGSRRLRQVVRAWGERSARVAGP
jgi:predicted dehydrogenase